MEVELVSADVVKAVMTVDGFVGERKYEERKRMSRANLWTIQQRRE